MMMTKEQALNDVNDLLYYAKIRAVLPPNKANAMANRAEHYINQSQPEGYVLFPASLTNDMLRAFAISTVGRWDSATEAEKQEFAEKLQSAFDEMRAAAPKPGGERPGDEESGEL